MVRLWLLFTEHRPITVKSSLLGLTTNYATGHIAWVCFDYTHSTSFDDL